MDLWTTIPVETQHPLTSSDADGFMVSAFGCHFRVNLCLDARADLERFIYPTLARSRETSHSPTVSIRVDRVDLGFQLSVDGAAVITASEPLDLVVDLVRVLDETVIQRQSAFYAIHAGVVEWKGRALILPGGTHSGKSTLVAELLRQGATYFSDEYALVDHEGIAHPYPRPLLVRRGSPQQFPVLAEQCNAKTGNNPARVGWIVAVVYDPAGRWQMNPLPQSMALIHLLQNTPHALAESPSIMGAFERAVAGAHCYAGTRLEAGEAAAEILRLADSTL